MQNREDMVVGHRFGNFEVSSILGKKKWQCTCACGNVRELYLSDTGRESCGCLTKAEIKVGDKFQSNLYGEVIVISYVNANKIEVEFIESGFKRFATSGNIVKGKLLDTSAKRINPAKRMTLDEFILAAQEVHGDSFDYSEMEYSLSTIPTKVTCRKHGEVIITPNNHLAGAGCAKCWEERKSTALTKTLEVYLSEVKGVHGTRYDYSKVVYRGCFEPVTIICKDHGEFQQRANTHLMGSGCTLCGFKRGFSTALPATLYFMESPTYIKVGITNKDTAIRARDISKSSGTSVIIVKEYHFEVGKFALDAETALLRKLNSRYKNPNYKFDGYTECFADVDKVWLMNEFERIVKEVGND